MTTIVPLRSALRGKARLAPLLPLEERAELIRCMFEHVIGCLRASSVVEQIVVATGGPSAIELARSFALETVPDATGPGGLTSSLQSLVDQLPATSQVLIVMPDLPHLTAGDVDRLAAAAVSVTVAPTSDGGTGGLALGPRARIPPQYGPRSAEKHVAAGRRAGLTTSFRRLAGFELDVDTPDDFFAMAPSVPTMENPYL